MAIDPGRVKALFQAAIEQDDPAERRAFLDREIAGDPELGERIEALLAAHDRPTGPLDRPLDAGLQATVDVPGEGTRSYRKPESSTVLETVIAGRYKIRQEIGEGGMGCVYLAEQTQPVKRMVALKLIKVGMDSRTVLARFETERQALALMDHPHIAKVLDAGTTEAGRPFFVMELVKGIPLTEYCDRHQLDLPTRLAIFRQICSAVQHAHQKGIIHRDLKPTNILIESHDGHPVPKVIDFGLAKATSGMQLSEHSLFTAFGSVTGTPLYMAPEQATFNALDVDTRADIYALGVILYELLTGSTPIERDTMKRAALDEMLRFIREVEPPTPSSRVSTSGSLPSLAANRHVEPMRLSRLIRGDLDWIVMKALAKERDRRYDSAIGMANDIERYLHHEPVTAGPPTAIYRMRKFVRRNRGQVAAAALVLLALVVGVLGTTLGLLEARRQQQIALAEATAKENARAAEAQQRAKAETLRQQAEKRLAQVARMNEILGSIFDDLNPTKIEADGKALSVVLGERLEAAASTIEGETTGDPVAVARMQVTLGRSLYSLGYSTKAIEVLTKARDTLGSSLGPNHRDTLLSMNSLAISFDAAGRRDEALKLREQVLALQKAKSGLDNPDTLLSMNNLANSFDAAGRRDEALNLREETLALQKAKLGPDHPATLRSMNNLAISYHDAGRRDEALKLREQVLALRKAKLGSDHPDTLNSMNSLAISYHDAGRRDEALKLREQVLALQKAKLGSDHPDTLNSMFNLAISYHDAGRRDEALKLREETLALQKAKLGPDHPDTLRSMNNLATSYAPAGRRDEALKLREETLALMKAKLGPDHPDTLQAETSLVGIYENRGDWASTEPLYRDIVDRARRSPNNRRALDNGLAGLGRVSLQLKKWPEAEASLRDLLALREAANPDGWSTFNARSMLGGALLGQGKTAEAEPLLRSGYEGMAKRADKIPTSNKHKLPESLDRLITFGEATGKADEVKAWKEERAKLGAAKVAPMPETEKK